jgi:hypothetical protein
MSSPPIAVATTSGFACWIFNRYAVKSRVFCGTSRLSMILPPAFSTCALVAADVVWPHT